MIQTTKVFSQGNDECEHKFVYGLKNTFLFTFPPQYKLERICECCGREEEILMQEETLPSQPVKYSLIKEKFEVQK